VNYRKPLRSLIAASALAAGAAAAAPVAGAQPGPRIVAVYQTELGSGGYVLYSNGMLNAQKGAPFYGDARKSGLNNFTTMAQSFWGGYWLINSVGRLFLYGTGCFLGTAIGPSKIVGPIIGTIGFGKNESGSGFYEVNSAGALFRFTCM
jgi:hypothetical protein